MSPKGLLGYLIDHGLAPSDAVDRVVLSDRSSRQENYHIQWGCGTAYVVKHATTPDRNISLRHEVSIYRQLATQPGFRLVAPDLVHADPEAGLLVLLAVNVSRSCDPLAVGSRRMLVVIARMLGRALAMLHALPPEAGVPRSPLPAALALVGPPLEFRAHLGSAALELVRLVQADAVLRDVVMEGRATWRRATCIHGEVKWPHCLLASATAAGRRRSLNLVDFESAGIGDPAWDVGCVLASYLTSWLASMPPPVSAEAETLVTRCAVPLSDLQLAIRAFWDTYVAGRGLAREQSSTEVAAAVRFAVARLLWTAVETNSGQESLTPRSLLTVQLARNLAERQDDALTSLLGLVTP